MGLITPTGTITLYKDVPFDQSYAHSIYFGSPEDQAKYFNSRKLVNGELSNQNYVKTENGKIRVQVANYGVQGANNINIDNASYMSWKNTNAGNNFEDSITFYAFITGVDMISINVVEISYQVDLLQTYIIQGSITLKECFIDRETPEDDNYGDHTVPENFSFKDEDYNFYNKTEQTAWSTNFSDWHIVVFSSYNILTGAQWVSGSVAGMPQGVACIGFDSYTTFGTAMNTLFPHEHDPNNYFYWGPEEYTAFCNGIIAIIAVPPEFSPIDEREYYNPIHTTELVCDTTDLGIGQVYLNGIQQHTWYIDDNGEDNPYSSLTLRYKKSLTYPFNMMFATDNEKGKLYVPWERMRTSTWHSGDRHQMGYILAFQPDFQILCYVVGGQGLGQKPNFERAITIGDFPQIPYNTNSYIEWLAQSKVGTTLNILGGILKPLIGNETTLDKIVRQTGSMASGLIDSDIGDVLGISQTSKAMGGAQCSTVSGSATLVAGYKTLYTYQRIIKKEYLQNVDDYFKMNGYAVNYVGVPSIAPPSGRNQKYIKTSGCLVTGKCPAEYCRQIESIFNKGVTWWKSNKIGEYN